MIASSSDLSSDPTDNVGRLRDDRPMVWSDSLYGGVRIAGWAAILLATPPFLRLADISLSDVPGTWLFGPAFPSRLDHARGVYHLARHARPRDRILQVAALAHDLGHGPFSHVSEPLMRSMLGCDHEERAARQMEIVRGALSASARRRLGWLDWYEASSLVRGTHGGPRGALLNGHLDFDNIDHVARFSLAAGLGRPDYDGVELARALRLRMPDASSASPVVPDPTSSVFLLPEAESAALAWRESRRAVFGFLHDEHRNLAPHAMLRRMIELAALYQTLPRNFLDMSDATAIACLARNEDREVATLAQRLLAGATAWYACQWEAEVEASLLPANLTPDPWQFRAELESDLASESGLPPGDVIVEVVTARTERTLPPIGAAGKHDELRHLPPPRPTRATVHLFAAAGTPRDYCHRLRTAAERRLGDLGAIARPTPFAGQR